MALPTRSYGFRPPSTTYASPNRRHRRSYGLQIRFKVETDRRRPMYSSQEPSNTHLQTTFVRSLSNRSRKETPDRCCDYHCPPRSSTQDQRPRTRSPRFRRSIRILRTRAPCHKQGEREFRTQIWRRHHLLRSCKRFHPMPSSSIPPRRRYRHIQTSLRASSEIMRRQSPIVSWRQRNIQV